MGLIDSMPKVDFKTTSNISRSILQPTALRAPAFSPTACACCMLLHAAAYILHQQLRTQALASHRNVAGAAINGHLQLFKFAVQVRQYKNNIVLHLPSACPVKHLLQTLTERLYLPTPARILNSS